MDLKEIHNALICEIQEALLYVAAGYPVARIGREIEMLSEYFQVLGICHILEFADQERLRENLVRSGFARRYFLRKSREDGNDKDARLALGRTEAFLCGLAAGNLKLAREIADLSINTWHPDWEYEDDFCYYLFLHRFVQEEAPVRAELADLLLKFEKVLEGGRSPRLDVCKALFARNDDALRAALTALMEQRDEEMIEARERNLERDPAACVCWARSFVSIEGLALLRVAELAGMSPLEPGEELPLCPTLAMLPISDKDYLDMFTNIENELARGR